MSAAPEKIHLIPDEWHLHNVGQLDDGRLIYHGTEMQMRTEGVQDFLVTYLFDTDGSVSETIVDDLGFQDGDNALVEALFEQNHLKYVEVYKETDIWVRPFTVELYGTKFGFSARNVVDDPDISSEEREEWRADFAETNDSGWRVEAVPSNALSFYPPWDEGGYDT